MEYLSEKSDFIFSNTAVSLGKFDGLHLGHKLLFDTILSKKEEGCLATIFTFDFPPLSIIDSEPISLIYTPYERSMKFEQMGIDVLIEYPFTEDVAHMSPRDFVKNILIDKLNTKYVVVGDDFGFGYKRSGTIELLRELSYTYNFELIVYAKVKKEEEVVSSTLIRKQILLGNIEKANLLLGRPYSIVGQVMHGRKLGRRLGIPTTNLVPVRSKLLPPNGVYITRTKMGNTYYNGVTNVGTKPTVGEEAFRGVETYMFDFDQDIYGKEIEVEFYKYLRPELKFQHIDELIEKMQVDIADAKNYFSHSLF